MHNSNIYTSLPKAYIWNLMALTKYVFFDTVFLIKSRKI